MTFNQVLYVLEVARHQSFSKAAEALFITQPALSLQIRKLETELGYTLFTRTKNGVFLTEDGLRFCDNARPVVDGWKSFEEQIRAQSVYRRRIRVGIGPRAKTNGWLGYILDFFRAHSEWDVDLITEAGADYFTALKEDKLDVALDCVPDLLLASVGARDFYCLELVREKQCVLLPPFHDLAGRRALRLEELQEESMITGMETSMEARFFRNECKKKGLSFARIYYSDGIETIMELVRNGNGFTLGPESFGDYYHVAAVPLEPSEEQSFSFVCLYSNRNRPELKLFRSYLKGMGSTSCCPE